MLLLILSPGQQRLDNRTALFIAHGLTLGGLQFFGFTLEGIQLLDPGQGMMARRDERRAGVPVSSTALRQMIFPAEGSNGQSATGLLFD